MKIFFCFPSRPPISGMFQRPPRVPRRKMRTWSVVTGPTIWTSSSPACPTPWAWAMSGGSPTSAIPTEEVRLIYFLPFTIVRGASPSYLSQTINDDEFKEFH